jgi:hypothetical protein
MEHATWLKVTAPSARLGPNANLPIARTSRPQHATNARRIYSVLKLYGIFFYLLPAWKHGCMFVGALHFSRTLQ